MVSTGPRPNSWSVRCHSPHATTPRRSLIRRRALFLGCPRLGRGGRDPRYGSKCRDFRDWTQQDLLPSRLSSVLPEVQPDSGNVSVTRWSSPREALCTARTSQVPHLLGRTTFFSNYGPFSSTAIGLEGRLWLSGVPKVTIGIRTASLGEEDLIAATVLFTVALRPPGSEASTMSEEHGPSHARRASLPVARCLPQVVERGEEATPWPTAR